MPILTRRAALGGTASLLAASAAGPAQAAATLEFTTWQIEEPGFGDWWKEVIAAFKQANPATKIKVTGSRTRTIWTSSRSASPPTGRRRCWSCPPTASAPSPARTGCSRWRTASKAPSIATDWSSLQQDLSWDGKTQGVLLMGYAFMLFYNQALLDAAGIGAAHEFGRSGSRRCRRSPIATRASSGFRR